LSLSKAREPSSRHEANLGRRSQRQLGHQTPRTSPQLRLRTALVHPRWAAELILTHVRAAVRRHRHDPFGSGASASVDAAIEGMRGSDRLRLDLPAMTMNGPGRTAEADLVLKAPSLNMTL